MFENVLVYFVAREYWRVRDWGGSEAVAARDDDDALFGDGESFGFVTGEVESDLGVGRDIDFLIDDCVLEPGVSADGDAVEEDGAGDGGVAIDADAG
ncbi:MAG: hypothetical protein RL215_2364 [Planctomycetota bacterium]